MALTRIDDGLTRYTKSIVDDTEYHSKHHHVVGSAESPKFDTHEESQTNGDDHQDRQGNANPQNEGIPGLGVDLWGSIVYPAHIDRHIKKILDEEIIRSAVTYRIVLYNHA
jgi:hypothetical protein